ncbi:MAG: ABC transporter ATP-binding protein [Desulfobacteraceae bacterium]
MDNTILEIKELTHTYPGSRAGIFHVNLTVSRGEFIILAGKNGSGKTTLLRHFNALLTPDSGQVLVHGKDAQKKPTLARKTTGMVFQDADTQIVGETVYDDIAFGPENFGLPRSEIRRRVETALETLGLAGLEERNPATLSGGEKRRLAIAGVLAMYPEIIVLDEPFSNLDYPGVLDLLSCIEGLQRDGQTIIIAIHDIEKVIRLATRMIIMDQGRIAHDDKPVNLMETVAAFGVRKPEQRSMVQWE